MTFELTGVQSKAFTRELSQIPSRADRYPLTPRIVALKEILGQLRPEPEREPLPPRRHYEPPSRGEVWEATRVSREAEIWQNIALA
jgi:hypothetical protein